VPQPKLKSSEKLISFQMLYFHILNITFRWLSSSTIPCFMF